METNPPPAAIKLDTSEASFGDWWLITVDAKGEPLDVLDQFHDEATGRAEGEQYARKVGLPFVVGEVLHLFPR